jgi:hypothetical protein
VASDYKSNHGCQGQLIKVACTVVANLIGQMANCPEGKSRDQEPKMETGNEYLPPENPDN